MLTYILIRNPLPENGALLAIETRGSPDDAETMIPWRLIRERDGWWMVARKLKYFSEMVFDTWFPTPEQAIEAVAYVTKHPDPDVTVAEAELLNNG